MADFEDIEIGEHLISGDITSVTVVNPWRGNPHECPSKDDWDGYRDIEFVITKIESLEDGSVVEGDDLDLPEDVDEDALEGAVWNAYEDGLDDY